MRYPMASPIIAALLLSSLCLTSAQIPAPAPAPGAAPVSSSSTGGNYIAINCGGITPVNTSIPSYYGSVTYGTGPFYNPNNTVVSSAGVVFLPDRYYSGESTKPLSYPGPLNASVVDPALYLTERFGVNFRYDIDVPNGNYTVFHHFAELQYNTAGARLFNVTIQGRLAVAFVDIFALAGANTPLIVPVNVTVTTGMLTIQFNTIYSSNTAGQAKVNALQIVPLAPSSTVISNTPPTSYHIDSGSLSNYTATTGVVYTGDAFFSNVIASSAANVTLNATLNSTVDARLYTTVRTGPAFTYYLNLANGYYLITLRFVESQFTQAGQRVFSVAVQGLPTYPAIDILANSTTGLLTLTTTAVVANGQLRILFTGLTNSATVAAIDVVPLVGGTNTIVAIDCGSPLDTVTGEGIIFQKDTFFASTTTNSSAALSTNPYQPFLPFNSEVDGFLYPTVREGNFSYTVPLPNGNYLVTLFFAEVVATGPRQRIFDVLLQGTPLITQLDIFQKTGANVTVYKIEAAANVTTGSLVVTFQPSAASALMNVTLSNYTLGSTNYTNALLPPLVNALLIQPGVPSTTATAAVAPAPAASLAPALISNPTVVIAPAPSVTAATVNATAVNATAPTALPLPSVTAATVNATAVNATVVNTTTVNATAVNATVVNATAATLPPP